MNTITLITNSSASNGLASSDLVSTESSSQLITPSKVICIGRNYVEHIKELGNEIPDDMVVFLKPNSAISTELHANHNDDILHYEAELCFLYQGGKFTAVALGLDLTKRDLQSKLKAKGLPWERAKAFNSSAILSDFVHFDENNMSQLNLSLIINDKPTQLGGVSLMMYKPDEILSELQTFLTLEDGDIVMTGTPKGVGIVNSFDSFVGQVFINEQDKPESISTLLNCQWQAT